MEWVAGCRDGWSRTQHKEADAADAVEMQPPVIQRLQHDGQLTHGKLSCRYVAWIQTKTIEQLNYLIFNKQQTLLKLIILGVYCFLPVSLTFVFWILFTDRHGI